MENKQPTASASSSWGFGTRAILAGQEPDPTTGALVVPISLATTFLQDSPGVHKGFEYSRTDNPTRRAFEANVAACENAQYGIGFASGSAATMTILHMLKAGDHVAAMDDCYGGTYRYFTKIATPMGLDFSFADFSKEGEVERILTDKTKLIWMESPTNPTLKLTDIRKVAEVAKKRNILLVVDNTFMSPYFQNPLDLGADIVVHSVTKYLNGHSDVVMGMVLTNSDEIKTRLRFLQNGIGAVPSPFDCFLAMRGMKTLHLRMREHAKNALHIAQFLEAHPKVEKVVYPGLPSHPQHELAKAQMKGFGGMVTFYVKGELEQAKQFLENLHIFHLAESLGSVESLVDFPPVMTHAAVPKEEREKLGISDTLVRLSVGVEDLDDLVRDLETALEHVKL